MTFVIKNVREVKPEKRAFPKPTETLGKADDGDFRIYLAQQAEEKILQAAPPELPAEVEISAMARSFMGENECGGILIGNVFTTTEQGRTVTYTAIIDAVPAEEATAGPTHVEMGVDDLMAVSQYIERLQNRASQRGQTSQWRVVGWYHTHPGFGVFMSGTDRATQKRVFGTPWQVAVVYDPINGEYGMFFGPDSDCAQGWYLFDSVHEGFPEPLPLSHPSMATRRRGRARAAEIPEMYLLRAQLEHDFKDFTRGWYNLLAGYEPPD
ncbi:MAG: Mov34/MPN/PAD-1 family protein [Blastocatellia bacterium]|nr:Mov34/MPN/PAD-1 family protein [Blastocatellia bacterium]